MQKFSLKKIGWPLLLAIASINATAQGSWTKKANYPGRFSWSCADVSLNGKGYIGTGMRNVRDWYEYNPATNTWTRKTDYPGTETMSPVAVAYNNLAYVGLGGDKEFYSYNATTDTWRRLADFPGPVRNEAVAFTSGGKIYAGLGNDAASMSIFSDFYAYNPATDTWSRIADFPVARTAGLAFSINDIGYAGCGVGHSGVPVSDQMYQYNVATNSWSAITPIPGPSYIGSVFVLGNYAYASMGICENYPNYAVWRYDPAGNSWSRMADYPDKVNCWDEGVGLAINGKGYMGLGDAMASPGTYIKDFYEYTPDATTVHEHISTIPVAVPNPVENELRWLSAGVTIDKLIIYNKEGSIVLNQLKPISGLDISFLQNGNYVLEFHSGTNKKTVKLLKTQSMDR